MDKHPTPKIHCHYYGPIASVGKPSIGGYEAANRKNIDTLRALGVNVTEHPNPVKPKIPGGAIVYLKLLVNPFGMLRSAGKKETVVHITPLPRMLWYPSLFCVWLAKRLGLKTVVDIRAGSFIRFYENRGRAYRWAVRNMLNFADAVTVEGKAYVEYIRKLTDNKVTPHYFPNIVKEKATDRAIDSSNRRYNIFYFGRISYSKGYSEMIDAINSLDDRFHLYLAGNISDGIVIPDSPKITHFGSLSPEELAAKLPRMGFFLFPSKWSGEGQSNSLIEAMGAGLVPVASDNGFSQDVVADAGYVLPITASGKEYAKKIACCADSGFDEMSDKAVRQIRINHNVCTEIKKLVDIYNRLITDH